MLGDGTSDPAKMQQLWNLHIPEEGGVLDPKPKEGIFTKLRHELFSTPVDLYEHTQANKLPPDLLKAALNEQVCEALSC